MYYCAIIFPIVLIALNTMAIRFLLILLALLVIVTIACIHEGRQFTIQVKESAKDKPLCYLVSQGHACKTLDYILWLNFMFKPYKSKLMHCTLLLNLRYF